MLDARTSKAWLVGFPMNLILSDSFQDFATPASPARLTCHCRCWKYWPQLQDPTYPHHFRWNRRCSGCCFDSDSSCCCCTAAGAASGVPVDPPVSTSWRRAYCPDIGHPCGTRTTSAPRRQLQLGGKSWLANIALYRIRIKISKK